MLSNLCPAVEDEIASKFRLLPLAVPGSSLFPAQNLYELFVHDLSSIVSGACQARHAAQAIYHFLPADQIGLRRLTLGLSTASRASLAYLPTRLVDEGLILPPIHDTAVCALLAEVEPGVRRHDGTFCHVLGARLVAMFQNVALNLEARLVDAAENAQLLGSDSLHEGFLQWAGAWHEYLGAVRFRHQEFRARAYAAGLSIDHPIGQCA